MVSIVVRLAVLVLFLVGVAGCSSVIESTKAPSAEREVVEEDVAETEPAPPAGDQSQVLPAPQDSIPFPSVQGDHPDGEPRDRPPRRLIWRDQKGSVRGWAPAPERDIEPEQ